MKYVLRVETSYRLATSILKMKLLFSFLIAIFLSVFVLSAQSLISDSNAMRIRGNASLYLDGVKIISCDSSGYFNLINTAIKYLDKKSKDTFYVSNKLEIYIDSLPSGDNYSLCDDITSLQSIISQKGLLINPDKYDGNTNMFKVYQPIYNARLNSYLIFIRSSHGEWGSSIVMYSFSKKGRKFKFVKKSLQWIS